MGILLAYMIRTRGKSRKNAASTLAIHSLGGIQEVYFSYVLMRPQLLLPLIAGNMAGIYVFQYFNAGLVSIPSPASLFLIVGLSPPDDTLYVLFGIVISIVVSLSLSMLVIKSTPEIPDIALGNREHDVVQRLVHVQQWDEVKHVLRPVSLLKPSEVETAADPRGTRPDLMAERAARIEGDYTVCFACDAGMGSSAMGAAILRKKLRSSELEEAVTVVHSSLDQIPLNASMIVTHSYLLNRAMHNAPGREYMSLENYTDPTAYETILNKLAVFGHKALIRRDRP